jgi:FkbM family methyltransferase
MAIVQKSIRAITHCHVGPTRFGNLLARWAQRHYADSLDVDERHEIIAAHLDRGLRMKVVPSHHIGGAIYWRGAYARRILRCIEPFLSPDAVMVDVGANQGEVSLFAARRLSQGRVIAFEPAPSNYARLLANARLNSLDNIVALDHCLGEQAGSATLFFPDDQSTLHRDGWNEGVSSLFADGSGTQCSCTVAVRRMDDVFDEMALERLDLMKIDVEGAELPVLRGGRETLQRFRPVVVIEMNAETFRLAGYEPSDVYDVFAELDYEGFIVNRAGRPGRTVSADVPDHCDVLWIPRGVKR